MALRFHICLPTLPSDPAEQAEIASGELTVVIGVGGNPIVVPTSKEQQTGSDPHDRCVDHQEFIGQQGDPVDMSFVYIDDAGNRSANPSVASAVLSDTIPPVDPGALGLMETEEVPDPTPEPEPEPEP